MLKLIIWPALAFMIHPVLGIIFFVAEAMFCLGRASRAE